MLDQAKDFFDNVRHTAIDYIQRQDAIGGCYYISLRKVCGKNVLAIGEEESGNEFDLKVVKSMDEVERIVEAIR